MVTSLLSIGGAVGTVEGGAGFRQGFLMKINDLLRFLLRCSGSGDGRGSGGKEFVLWRYLECATFTRSAARALPGLYDMSHSCLSGAGIR